MNALAVKRLVAVYLGLLACASAWGEENRVSEGQGAGSIILKIGEEDGSYKEFALRGFREVDELIVDAGTEFNANSFPFAQFKPGVISDRGVTRITLNFVLDRDLSEVTLRLAREGSETTVVMVDGKTQHKVTSELLGSRDGNHFGAASLPLGPLPKGAHSIVLTVDDAPDSVPRYDSGSGYAWDALLLTGR